MKQITIVRHAKSSWKDSNLADFERPLNKRGKRDAPFMGNILKKLIGKPDLIISSAAARALNTAKILAKELEYPTEKIKKDIKIYLAEEVELFKIIKKLPDKYQNVLLIGHNPGLTDFSNMLCDFIIEKIPTTGIVSLQFEIEEWERITRKSGQFKFFEFPKKYFELVKKDNS